MSQDDLSPTDPGVDDLIDQNIKLLYDGLIQEGLPDRFKDLLAVIKAEDKLAENDDDAAGDRDV